VKRHQILQYASMCLVFIAATTASQASWLWVYQAKTPKCLFKKTAN